MLKYARLDLNGAKIKYMCKSIMGHQRKSTGVKQMTNMLNMTSNYVYWMSLMGVKWVTNVVDNLNVASEFILDVTRLKSGIFELGHPNELSQEGDEPREDFISAVTHELRTPLTSIRALSAILHDNPELDTIQRDQFLSIIVEESEKLACLVEEVQDLAELELGEVEWHLSEVDLKEVIQECLVAVSRVLTQKNIQLQLRLPDEVPPLVTDRDRIKQVILSLLSNAIKFCDSSCGWVGIRLRMADDALQVDVSDNGPGVDSATRPGLSDKLYHPAEDISVEEPQTTSLGLLISRCIVSHFGGKFWVESKLNHGAKFCFTLPLR